MRLAPPWTETWLAMLLTKALLRAMGHRNLNQSPVLIHPDTARLQRFVEALAPPMENAVVQLPRSLNQKTLLRTTYRAVLCVVNLDRWPRSKSQWLALKSEWTKETATAWCGNMRYGRPVARHQSRLCQYVGIASSPHVVPEELCGWRALPVLLDGENTDSVAWATKHKEELWSHARQLAEAWDAGQKDAGARDTDVWRMAEAVLTFHDPAPWWKAARHES